MSFLRSVNDQKFMQWKNPNFTTVQDNLQALYIPPYMIVYKVGVIIVVYTLAMSSWNISEVIQITDHNLKCTFDYEIMNSEHKLH